MAQNRRDEIVIRLEGVFDAVSAWTVRNQLEGVSSDATVVLDFSQVREFRDLGVAVMASGLDRAQTGQVVVRGLRQHQARMFRYFGVDLDALRHAAGGLDRFDGADAAAG
jgi:anti-anti-sigma regulatory factor